MPGLAQGVRQAACEPPALSGHAGPGGPGRQAVTHTVDPRRVSREMDSRRESGFGLLLTAIDRQKL